METVESIHRGDVVLVPFPYVSDFTKAKTRPALVIQNDIGNRFSNSVIVALISSSIPKKQYPMHYRIPYPSPVARAAGLRRNSIVKMDTILTLPKRVLLRRLGSLPKAAMREADQALAFSLDLRLAFSVVQ